MIPSSCDFQTGLLSIAIIEIVASCASIMWWIIVIGVLKTQTGKHLIEMQEIPYLDADTVVGFLIILSVLNLIIAIILLVSTHTYSKICCIICHIIQWIMFGIFFIFTIIMGTVGYVVTAVLVLLYMICKFVIVYYFVKKINERINNERSDLRQRTIITHHIHRYGHHHDGNIEPNCNERYCEQTGSNLSSNSVIKFEDIDKNHHHHHVDIILPSN